MKRRNLRGGCQRKVSGLSRMLKYSSSWRKAVVWIASWILVCFSWFSSGFLSPSCEPGLAITPWGPEMNQTWSCGQNCFKDQLGNFQEHWRCLYSWNQQLVSQVQILKKLLVMGSARPAKNSYCSVVGDHEKTGDNLIQWLPNLPACWNHLGIF